MDRRDDHDGHPGQEAADQGQQVDQGHEDAQEEGEGNAEDGQRDPHHDAGNQRSQEIPQHVAGDRANGLIDDPLEAQ